MRSSPRKKAHQSGFPQIWQGLRRLTRPKMVEVDVGMAWLPTASFQSGQTSSGKSGSSGVEDLEKSLITGPKAQI
jgi:hypothetical protein